ncbi:MAG: hypothetical protein WBM44_17675 [Waterburya sp.]
MTASAIQRLPNFLFLKFALLVGHRRVRGHGLELEVRGEPKNRYPYLTISKLSRYNKRDKYYPRLPQSLK